MRSNATLCFLCLSVVLFSCGDAKQKAENTPKFRQYYVQGEKLYLKFCSNCHQENGSGLGRVYPPLNKSDYMQKHFNDVICIIRNGKEGELFVNGLQFNQAMPALPQLTDLEVAEIATYIYNTWEHQRGIIDVKTVTPILQNCNQPN